MSPIFFIICMILVIPNIIDAQNIFQGLEQICLWGIYVETIIFATFGTSAANSPAVFYNSCD